MIILETSRLILRELVPGDAPLILELVNEPAWLKYIGDRQVHTLEEAEGYLRRGPLASYSRHGFGLWLIVRKADGTPAGICGLIKRETLDDVDLGFALLERFSGQGYATESASAVLAFARDRLGLRRVVAVTQPDNAASIQVLKKLALRRERRLRLPPADAEVDLHAIEFPSDEKNT